MLKLKLSYIVLSLVLCTPPIFASFLLVEDFEAYVAGSVINGQGDWTSDNGANQVLADPAKPSNNVLLLGSGVERNTTYNDNASLDTPDGSVATLFTGQNPVSPISLSVIALNPLAPGGTTYSWRYSDSFVLGLDYLLQGSEIVVRLGRTSRRC